MRHEDVDDGTNDLTARVLDAAILVHKTMGPGLFEKVYHLCLLDELRTRGLEVASEVPVHLVYNGRVIETAFRLDLLVERRVVVEVKAVDLLKQVHFAQVLTYLRLSGHEVGLLLNFNAFPLAIRRVANTHSPLPRHSLAEPE